MTTQYYTAGETAEVLGVDWTTIMRWIKSGRLPARKFGGRWRIPREEIDYKSPDDHIDTIGIKTEKPATGNSRFSETYTS